MYYICLNFFLIKVHEKMLKQCFKFLHWTMYTDLFMCWFIISNLMYHPAFLEWVLFFLIGGYKNVKIWNSPPNVWQKTLDIWKGVSVQGTVALRSYIILIDGYSHKCRAYNVGPQVHRFVQKPGFDYVNKKMLLLWHI